MARLKTRLAKLEANAETPTADYPIRFVELVELQHAHGTPPGMYWRGVPGSGVGVWVYDPETNPPYPPGVVSPGCMQVGFDFDEGQSYSAESLAELVPFPQLREEKAKG